MSLPSKRELGLSSIILLGINSMIGTSVFILPGKVMSLVGTFSPYLYLVATLLVTTIALCFAKCATMFNRNGAAYLYAREAFGNFVGFEVGMMKWVVSIIAWATLAVGFVTGLSALVPGVMEEPIRSYLAIAMISAFSLLNLVGLNSFKFLNNIVTITKITPLLLIIFFGFFYLESEHFFVPSDVPLASDAMKEAFLMVFYAFTGFETLAVAAQDMQNPQKNIPLAIVIVIGFCSFLYFSLQIVAIGVLGPQLAQSVTPISDIAFALTGKLGKDFVNIGMLVSICGINLASSFMSPRVAIALAEDKLIPSAIAQKNRFGAPYIAILLTAFLACVVALSGNFYQLAMLSVVARFAQYIPTCLALLVLRRNPKWKSHLQGSFNIVLPILALSFSFWLLWQVSLMQLVWGFGALFIGAPLYHFFKATKTELEEIPQIQS